MLNSLENSSVTYEDLAQIEQEFEDVEKEISKSLLNQNWSQVSGQH